MSPAFVAPFLKGTTVPRPFHASKCVRASASSVPPSPSPPTPLNPPDPQIRGRDGSLPSRPGAKTYQVRVEDPQKGIVHTYTVPEDRYVWHSMTDQGADIPASCRNGCCTTCAVKISNGQVQQREALGLLKEMRAEGYALLCVSYPRSDIDCILQDKDEVYVKQFGSSFESGGIEWGGFVPEDD